MALKLAVFIAAALGLPSLPCAAQEMADFYKGKQIAIVVGFTPGGSRAFMPRRSPVTWDATFRAVRI